MYPHTTLEKDIYRATTFVAQVQTSIVACEMALSHGINWMQLRFSMILQLNRVARIRLRDTVRHCVPQIEP
jgi:hypothetical protein